MTSKKKLKRRMEYWKGVAAVETELEKTWYDVAMRAAKEAQQLREQLNTANALASEYFHDQQNMTIAVAHYENELARIRSGSMATDEDDRRIEALR